MNGRPRPERSPGPRPVSDRLCLQGILFVLYNDISWQLLPPELGLGSGQTCWRRLDRWQKAGVFDRLHRVLLAELNAAGELDWSRACVDGSHIRAKKWGADTGPSPVERRKTGSKHHLICDGRGTPLKVITTAANVNDITQTLNLVDCIPPVAGRPADAQRHLPGGRGGDPLRGGEGQPLTYGEEGVRVAVCTKGPAPVRCGALCHENNARSFSQFGRSHTY
ncbi:IS5 family transposase [Streptomyces sp. NPDC058221]|uniref:IS5 family transposase n=1 Tax=Streptomyces sp. NPDC058221 TaxID=3346388 RepID=UPI0036EB264E